MGKLPAETIASTEKVRAKRSACKGINSPIHILADQRGRPLCLGLTGGQRHDST